MEGSEIRVSVIGGGVIGLCCALALRRLGAEVAIFERGVCGGGASLGNAGLVTPGFSTPLSAPGAIGRAVRWSFDGGSPFLVRPRLDRNFALWCLRFARSCSPATYRAGTNALLQLNARTFELFDELRAEGAEFEMYSNGVLFVSRTAQGLNEYAEAFELLLEEGYPGSVESFDAAALQRFEPSVGEEVVGALFASTERHVRPESLTVALLAALRHEGVEILEHSTVRGLRRNGREWVVSTSESTWAADRVLVAAGAWSNELLRMLKLEIPLEAAKGYSVTATGRGLAPRRPVYFTEAKVTCTPFAGGSLRLAGTLELTGLDQTLSRNRLDQLGRASSRYLREWRPQTVQLEWCGLRPLAPDGLPVIGELPDARGVFVATGHGMLGLTLGPATAEALSPVIVGSWANAPELDPFSPARF